MIQTLRDAAVDSQNELVRYNLNLIAAELEDAITAFKSNATEENLRRMTGHWSHGVGIMAKAKACARPVHIPQTTF